MSQICKLISLCQLQVWSNPLSLCIQEAVFFVCCLHSVKCHLLQARLYTKNEKRILLFKKFTPFK